MKKTFYTGLILFCLFGGLIPSCSKDKISKTEASYATIFDDSLIVYNEGNVSIPDRDYLIGQVYLNCIRNYPINFTPIESTIKVNDSKIIVSISYYCITEHGDHIMMIGINTFDLVTKKLIDESYTEALEKLNDNTLDR